MPRKQLLQSIFGRDWSRLAAKTLGISASSIYGWTRRMRPLSKYEATLLHAKVPARRRDIEKEWRLGLTAAARLTFEWARRERVIHLDREKQESLDHVSAAEAFLRDTTEKRSQ